MQLFGLQLSRAVPVIDAVPVEEPAAAVETKAAVPPSPALAPATGGWWPLTWIREAFSGAWQRNIATPVGDVMTFGAVFSCVTLIATDIAKMHLGLIEEQKDGTAKRVYSAAYAVLKKPNHYQTRIMFVMQWVISKLTWGNTYVLKERNNRGGEAAGNVSAMYILDPSRVQVLVAPNGDVYYSLSADVLAGIDAGIPAIPASEIIHDVMYPLYHPLIGVGPIHACGLAAVQGLRIQTNSARFFANGASLGGVLTAPGAISNETAQRLKEFWENKYSGPENAGKIAVLGDDLKFEALTKSTDAQLIEQLKMSAEIVCTAFHVPAYKVGVGAPPAVNNIEALDQQYYSQCLQILIECIEALLDEGLAVKAPLSTEFDLDDLLRMDSATLTDVQAKGVGAGLVAPNEGRRKLGLPPVKGGESPYLQQQNYSLAALAKRDAEQAAPASVSAGQVPTATPPPPPAAAPANEEPDGAIDGVIEEALALMVMKVSELEFFSDAA